MRKLKQKAITIRLFPETVALVEAAARRFGQNQTSAAELLIQEGGRALRLLEREEEPRGQALAGSSP